MDLVKIETDINFSVFKYESTNGLWQFGAREMLFGVRLCATSKNSDSYALDYCTADNVTFQLLLWSILHQIFGLLPETITEREQRGSLLSLDRSMGFI